MANSRVMKVENGLYFYEKDVDMREEIFSNNIDIHIRAEYYSPGLGCIIKSKEDDTAYLLKFGFKEITLYQVINDKTVLLKNIFCNIVPGKQSLSFIVKKRRSVLSIYTEDRTAILEYEFKNNIEKFQYGIYSNKGNIINSVTVSSNIPDYWNINMLNTDGGSIEFFRNIFSIKDCKNKAEIEQEKILLSPGIYHLKYEMNEIDKPNDISVYVYKNKDVFLNDSARNILDSNNSFEVLEEGFFNIKLSGKNGIVANIQITEKETDNYVESYDKQVINSKSKMEISTFTDIEEMLISFTMKKEEDGILINNGNNPLTPLDFKLVTFLKYYMKLNINLNLVSISTHEDMKNSISLSLDLQKKILSLFENMDVTIHSLISMKNGNSKDYITRESDKEILSYDITNNNPIIVTNKDGTVMDMSTEYLSVMDTVKNKPYKYIFTNEKKEVFDPISIFNVSKPIFDISTIKVYGILKDLIFNESAINNTYNEGISILDLSTKATDLLPVKYALTEKGRIVLDVENDLLQEKYQKIVVVYQKDNSYCLNYDYEKKIYNVDINTKDEYKLIYGNDAFFELDLEDQEGFILIRKEG